MKTSKRTPISNSRFLGFDNQKAKTVDKPGDDLVKFITTLIEMDLQHKSQS